MSIVRVGLRETKGFADGYDAIFRKKKTAVKKPAPAPAPTVKKAAPAAKAATKKAPAKAKKK